MRGEAASGEWQRLEHDITACRACARLCAYGAEVARVRRKAFAQETYWGQPVPGFGDPRARLLLVGLAPAAHGAHRTGRMFTGDRSGDFLFAALHRAGFASQATSRERADSLRLVDAYLTAAARCAPPGNRPLPEEFDRCRPFLERELELLDHARVVITLGALGHRQFLRAVGSRLADFPFRQDAEYRLGRWHLLPCYHPSQQNTFTGKLTPAMLNAVLRRARRLFDSMIGTGGTDPARRRA